jgi:hypothetical protein
MAEQANGGVNEKQSTAGLLFSSAIAKLFPRYTAVKREQESASKFFQNWYSDPATINRMQEQGYSDEDISNINKSIQIFGQLKVEKELGPLIGMIQTLPKHAKDKIIYDIGSPVPLMHDWLGYKADEHIGLSQAGRKLFKGKMKQPEVRSVLTHEAEHWVDPKEKQRYYRGPSEAGIKREADFWSEYALEEPQLTMERFGLQKMPANKKEWVDFIREGQESLGTPYLNSSKDFIKNIKKTDPEFGSRSDEELKDYYHYQKQNTEIRGRVMEVRRDLVDQGIIDPSTIITPEILRRVRSEHAQSALLKLDALFRGSGEKMFQGVSKLLNIIAGMEPQQTEAEGVFA